MLILFNFILMTVDYALFALSKLNGLSSWPVWCLLYFVNEVSLFISISKRFKRLKIYDIVEVSFYIFMVDVAVSALNKEPTLLAAIPFAFGVLTAVLWYRSRKEVE